MAIDKKAVTAVLEEIAMLLELAGENPFKARSYTSVAREIEGLDADLETLAREKRLREIKGVGDALETKLEELITTGNLAYHQELRAKFPGALFDLLHIPGLGAKRVKQLYDELGVDSLDALEDAVRSGSISGLKGFGPKMEQKILSGIAFSRQHRGQFLLHTAWQEAAALGQWLKQHPSLVRLEVAGSLRRTKEVIKDVDIVASSTDPAALMDHFVKADRVEEVTGHGGTKASVRLKSGMAADLRVVSGEQFPYALCHFTGSKEHNVVMRQRAKDRGLKLNEYGLFRGDTLIPCAEEQDIYSALDLPWIPPELREDMGEFELSEIPELVTRKDLLGLVHCHTNYSDGSNSLRQMADAARARRYKYVLISDHSQSAGYAGGLSAERVAEQQAEIDKLNDELDGIRILKGIESDIRNDGRLDYDEDTLKTFDCVIASIHSRLDMTETEATRRLITAIEHPCTSILGHPSGRLLLAREGYRFDVEKVLDACKANRVAIEINANPHRLDLDWRLVRRARDRGLMFSIGPDAHSVEGMDDVVFGVGMARKGCLTRAEILNCLGTEEFLEWRKSG